MSRTTTHRPPSYAIAWLLAWLALGAGLLFHGLGGQARDLDTEATAATATPVATAPLTKPIESIRVGERVLGENPLLSEEDRNIADPDPATWRYLKLRMTKNEGGTLDIELLRPLSWVEQHSLHDGATMELDLAELGAAGAAKVLTIDPSPRIHPGAGHVVTGTFKHSARSVIDVHLEGVQEPIGCTPNHPFWSEDRHNFVPAGELRIGETLHTASEQNIRVTDITRRGPPSPVYNIEVQRQHVYHVASMGVLVHNSNAPKGGRTSWKKGKSGRKKQGREPGEKKRQKENWKPRNPPKEPPPHTPSKKD